MSNYTIDDEHKVVPSFAFTPDEIRQEAVIVLTERQNQLVDMIAKKEAEVADAKAALKQVERSLKAFKNGD